MLKKEKTAKVKAPVKRGRPVKSAAAKKTVKAVKTVKSKVANRPAKKMTEAKIEALLEKRKSTATIPLFEYEYNLRLGLMFGVLIGVILTTYLWVLVNFIYF